MSRTWFSGRWLVLLIIVAGTLFFLGANLHLLNAALVSEPDCVAHLKPGHEQAGKFSAAQSAC